MWCFDDEGIEIEDSPCLWQKLIVNALPWALAIGFFLAVVFDFLATGR